MNATLEIDQMDHEAKAAMRDALIAEMQAATHEEFSKCWNRVRQRHPALFITNRETNADAQAVEDWRAERAAASQPRRERTLMETYHLGGAYSPSTQDLAWNGARLVNRSETPQSTDAALSSGDLAFAIDKFRAENKIPSYEAARNELRRRKPGLFGC